MREELHRLLLAWRILGSTRIHVAVVGIVVLVLAAFGLWHLISPASRPQSVAQNSPTSATSPRPLASPAPPAATARVSPGIEPSSPSAILNPPSSPSAAPVERQIAITDVRQEQRRGPRGETFVIATIGLASRTDVDALEIRISFFDLTPANEMRPTDAQVTYRWLTPVRDWSDPTPKFLTATYFKPRPPPWFRDRLRYGGFVVRVYVDGKLQDERSQPEALLAQLNRNVPPPDSSTIHSSPVTDPPSPPPSIPPSASPSAAPTTHRSPVINHAPGLPYGKPIPGKPGFVSSPYDPKFLIDVRGFPPGTLVTDPNTNKPFRVP